MHAIIPLDLRHLTVPCEVCATKVHLLRFWFMPYQKKDMQGPTLFSVTLTLCLYSSASTSLGYYLDKSQYHVQLGRPPCNYITCMT